MLRASAEEIPDNAIVVVGTDNASIDVPAVQAAVDQGGEVVLQGRFSFDIPATKPVASVFVGFPQQAEVLVSKAVRISGVRDEDGQMTTIEGGTIPFYVDASGASVTFRRLHFVQPTSDAVLVYAVRGLEIASSRVESVKPFKNGSDAFDVNTSGRQPTLTNPGTPTNVSGAVRIFNNEIDMIGGMPSDQTAGIVVFSVGVDEAPVQIHVTGNRIRNTTEAAINLRRVNGQACITHNVISTGAVGSTGARIQAIRTANTGSFVIAHNVINCEWPNVDAEGIGVFSQVSSWPVSGATVVDNDVTMSAPVGTSFNDFSAGIGIYGFASGNLVERNTIRGRARAGVSIPSVFPLPPQVAGAPQGNAIVLNQFPDFTPSVADISVGDHSTATRIVGTGTVDDKGTGTTICTSRCQ